MYLFLSLSFFSFASLYIFPKMPFQQEHEMEFKENYNPFAMTDINHYMAMDNGHPERSVAGFVAKLYQCLQSNDQHYVRWCKHNGIDMFVIDCIPEFTQIVLPKLFKHCKFASFVRQLNIYGFQRDTDARKSKDCKGRDRCRWYHTYFKPNRGDLFHLIHRKPPRYSRGKRQKKETDAEEDSADSIERRDSTSSLSSSSVIMHPSIVDEIRQEQSGLSVSVSPINFPIDIINSCPDELRNQLALFQDKYWQTYSSLTNERDKACNFIQAQEARIKVLENSISNISSVYHTSSKPFIVDADMICEDYDATSLLCNALEYQQNYTLSFNNSVMPSQPQGYENYISHS
ncbi:HSF-type DNA-binding-domain-containing protein [Sporodiniella umbellata]|nr:HSF-type DNA-binding-domain-containing protein [Sporodiniella umbellata]